MPGSRRAGRRRLQEIDRELQGHVSGVVRGIARDVTHDLIRTTPRDTGLAAANWIPSIGQPRTETVGLRSGQISASSASSLVGAALTGAGGGPPRGVPEARAEQAAGLQSLAGYEVRLGKVWITNNLPYISSLNDGHSTRQPAAFVQRAIASGVKRAALKCGR